MTLYIETLGRDPQEVLGEVMLRHALREQAGRKGGAENFGIVYAIGDLTYMQNKCLEAVTGKMTTREVGLAVGIETSRVNSFMGPLASKGYVKRGWRRGKCVWTRTGQVPE